MIQINFVAVLLGALAIFVIGFLLHGPVLGKLWMKLADIHPTGEEKFSTMVPQLVKNFTVNVVYAAAFSAVFSLAAPTMGGRTPANAVVLALIVWAGFLCTTTSIEVIWMGRKPALWLFEVFASLVSTVSMALIIAAF